MNNKIIRLVVLLIILLDVSFFYLIKNSEQITKYMNNYQKIILVILILIILYIMFFSGKIFKYKFIFGELVISFILINIAEIFISMYKYKQKFMDVIIINNFVLVMLSYFIFTYYLKKTKEYKKFQFLIIYVCTILSLLFIIQSISVTKGITFLSIAIDRYRFDELRIYESGYIINAGSILAISNVIDKNNTKIRRISSLIFFIICFIEILFVQKSRIGLLSQILVAILLLIISYRHKIKEIILASSLIIVAIYFLSTLPIMSNYINSISYEDGSYIVRTFEINFYINQIKENPILGMGFINSKVNSSLLYLLMGPNGNYYRNDVGIIGYTNTYGLVGFIWYLFLFVKIFRILWGLCINYKGQSNRYIEIIGLFCYIMLNSVTNVIFEPQRILTLPIFLSMIDYLYSSKKVKNILKKYN